MPLPEQMATSRGDEESYLPECFGGESVGKRVDACS